MATVIRDSASSRPGEAHLIQRINIHGPVCPAVQCFHLGCFIHLARIHASMNPANLLHLAIGNSE